MENGFLIPLNGLAPGKTMFEWSVGKEFFNSFGNEEILDAKVSVKAEVEKAGSYTGVDIRMDGSLTVACDRCLAELEVPVHPVVALSVKYHGSGSTAGLNDDGREIVTVPADDAELDLGQIIYDYACLALPLQRVHEDGDCDPQVAGRLGKDAGESIADESPFAALKGLFDN